MLISLRGSLTNCNYNVVNGVRVNGNKIGGNNGQIMVINGEDKCCIDGGIDQTKEIFLALKPDVSEFFENKDDETGTDILQSHIILQTSVAHSCITACI